MKTQEIINQLQKLVDTNGNVPFHINISRSVDKNQSEIDVLNGDIFYDDALKDICIILR